VATMLQKNCEIIYHVNHIRADEALNRIGLQILTSGFKIRSGKGRIFDVTQTCRGALGEAVGGRDEFEEVEGHVQDLLQTAVHDAAVRLLLAFVVVVEVVLYIFDCGD